MQPGTILKNRYRILKELSSTNFGETYLGEDRHLPNNHRCIVKHFQPKTNDPQTILEAKKLFDREAKVLYKLGRQSDRIPTLYAHFEEKGEFYLVQEYINGQDLGKEIVPGRRLSESYARALLAGVLEVLEVVHRQDVIHRDLKPQNLMRRDGKIVLIDFGAVKEIEGLMLDEEGKTRITVIVGTQGYMPGEQAAGRPKLSSDIYALGMVGIQALTGLSPLQLPEDPRTGEVIWRNLTSASEEFCDFLEKMVRYDFSKRFGDAMEARSALLSESPSSPPPTSPPPPPPPTPPPPPPPTSPPLTSVNPKRRQVLLWLVLGGMGFAGAVVARFLLDESSPPATENESKVSPSPTNSNSPPPEPTSPPPKVTTTQGFITVKVNSQGQIVERLPGEAEVLVENLGNGIGLEMVSIPEGSFIMGSPENEERRDGDEAPGRRVNVPSFFMGKYPVTQEQYEAVMGNNPSYFKGANRPMETVSWNDATEFCRRLSQRTGKIYGLPSEAEWEYACRAGGTTPFSFGETITTELANYEGSYIYRSESEGVYREETTDVDSFPPNGFGLYDLHGNVWEWCQDVWHENYRGAPTDGSAWESGGNGSRRLLRGGSWLTFPWNCRCANRYRLGASALYINVGFRVVLLPGL